MPAVSNTTFTEHDPALPPAARITPPRKGNGKQQLSAYELRQAFCEHLRAARERQGIGLQVIADSTKVSEGLFADLERGDLRRWPGGIYRRSFFREYATFIGLPGDSTVSEFVRLFPEEHERQAEIFVRGPLRLTLARPVWQVSLPRAQAAGLDLLLIALGTASLAAASGLGIWVALATVALLYHLTGTALIGGSPGRWLLHSPLFRRLGKRLWILPVCVLCGGLPARAQTPFQPEIGQPGKDVVWVPTPEVTVQRMLDLAKVTSADFVMDLGSGDGRNVIAAAKRGASALGVEYNPNMVALSRRLAAEAGVAERATFVQGDMFEADISKANVLALFLLPSNMLRLRSKFYDLSPGSRIVSNTFTIQDWDADETVEVPDCDQWCTVHLYIVPAKIGGRWRMGKDVLELKQDYQMLSGTLSSKGEAHSLFGQLRGTQVSFKAGGQAFTGEVHDREIVGTIDTASTATPWRATRE